MIGRKNVMSESTTLPIWSLGHHGHNHQGQEQFKGNESSTDPIYHQQATFSQFAPMNSFEVAELTWENGQLAMHGFPTKPAWGGRSGDTLESIVHQATVCHNNNIIHSPKPNPNPNPSKQEQQKMHHQNMETVGSVVASSGEKRTDNPRQVLVGHHGLASKRRERPSPEYDQHKGRKAVPSCNSLKGNDEGTDHRSTNDHTTTMMTSFESPTTMMTSFESPTMSTKTRTTDEDSACHGGSENQEEEREIRSETGRSSSARKGRAAVVHNQSERRRRDKINQKMKALQKLVPNACKTDKASILDEVIDYLKQLQAQVQMFKYMSPPQMMMPIGMQQQLQMSLLASMGMGMGMGMLDMSRLACPTAIPQPMSTLVHPNPVANNTSSTFVPPTPTPPPPFLVPPVIPNSSMPTVPQKPITDPGSSVSADPLQDTYNAILAQSMNAEVCSRMATLRRQQQINQNTQAGGSIPQSNPAQKG